jgi:hypothetical protein
VLDLVLLHVLFLSYQAYLDSDSLNQYDESFNVLNWWQDHKRTESAFRPPCGLWRIDDQQLEI